MENDIYTVHCYDRYSMKNSPASLFGTFYTELAALDAISDWVREELVKCAAKWNKLPSQEERRIKLTQYLINTFNNCQQTFQSIETINNFLNSNDYVSVSRRATPKKFTITRYKFNEILLIEKD